MLDDSIIKKVVINFLHYVNKKSIEEASLLYTNNRSEFSTVISILGEQFVVKLLETMAVPQPKKGKGNKK